LLSLSDTSTDSSRLVDVEVEFDYEAELPDELSIKAGEIIADVKRMDGGWWEGKLNGKRGVFPDNFVKVGQFSNKLDNYVYKVLFLWHKNIFKVFRIKFFFVVVSKIIYI
jgi:hypothetical protein